MFDKISENMKFFILLIVYTVTLTWWASALNTTVDQHSIITQKTVELLDAHISECRKKELDKARADYVLRAMQKDISHIKEDIDGFKKGRN